ncbi:MAG: biotin transporter BioY [Proteobacteria bacterium]|nr:biotin transporter BioY [Pseudomonadota bacterium]
MKNSLFNLNYPLQSLCWPKQNKLIKNVLLVLTGVFVLALASQLTIPLKPVPITFQSATVLLIALVYGARLGGATIASYLLAGACGLPVFAEMSSGLHVLLFNPTSGYLFGFFFATLLTGFLTQYGWGKNIISAFTAAVLGAVVIFALGILFLAHYIGWHQATLLGLQPFLITEPIKLVAVAVIAPRFWKQPVDADGN